MFEEDRDKVLESGADEFIDKPIQEALFLEKIDQCLKIEYLFKEVKGPPAEPLETITLTRDRLVVLPPALVEKMRAAVEGGYMERLAELTESKTANHPELMQKLLYLVDHNHYEALYGLFVKNDGDETDRWT